MIYNLEERLIAFAVLIVDVVESLSSTRAGNHFAGQLIRSGTSPTLHYGEVQSAESRRDFVHKLRVILKELRETRICLIVISRRQLSAIESKTQEAIEESRQLIAIFSKSVKTAESKGGGRRS